MTAPLQVVVDLESDPPEVLGTYVPRAGLDEADYIAYLPAHCAGVRFAPADCVTVAKVEL